MIEIVEMGKMKLRVRRRDEAEQDETAGKEKRKTKEQGGEVPQCSVVCEPGRQDKSVLPSAQISNQTTDVFLETSNERVV